jgi:hypothetical protein
MPQSFPFKCVIKIVQGCRSHAVFYCVQMPNLALIVTVSMLAFLLFSEPTAHGQMSSSSTPSQSTAQPSPEDGSVLMAPGSEDSESSEDDRQRSTSASSSATPLTLSAEQIIRILQQNPDLVVELKSQVADRMQQQGTPIDPNEISDDMLYSQIEANAELRANITTVLRARGYVSQDDLQAAGATSGTGPSNNTDLLGQQSLSSPDGMSFSKLAPGVGTDTGETSSDQGGIAANPLHPMSSTEVHPGGEQRRGRQAVNASTDLPKVIRQHAPYNLRSMRDLYTQIPEPTAALKRFGSEVFVNRDLSAMARGGSGRDTPLDVPLGPDRGTRSRSICGVG